MPFCANCGHEVAAGVAFCPQCGAAQPGAMAGTITVAGRQYAGFWRRVVGRIIDSIVVGIVGGTIGAIIGGGGLEGGGNPAGNLVEFVISAGYFLFFWTRGQTLGQMAMGVRLVDATGNPPDLQHAVIRLLMSFVSGIALGLGFLWAAFHAEKRTWHDMVAGTWVVRV